jgi:hypothetical protein
LKVSSAWDFNGIKFNFLYQEKPLQKLEIDTIILPKKKQLSLQYLKKERKNPFD